MKIIQTLWTKPGLKGGWLDERFNLFSWALSCLQLRKFYDDVELYTDTPGKELLVDTFGLPYSKVHVVLDDFKYPSYLWAAPKILSYSLQQEPFLHIDGDVYLFHPINDLKAAQQLVYQNKEMEMAEGLFYTKNIIDINEAAGPRSLPAWLQEVKINQVEALNAGVFGGSDMEFFREHASIAFDFFDNYQEVFEKMKVPAHANHIAEQVLASLMLDKKGVRKHTGLFQTNYFLAPDQMHKIINVPANPTIEEETSAAPVPFGYQVWNHFGISPHGRQYVHMIGNNKKSRSNGKMLARRLRADYPEYYERIMDYHASKPGRSGGNNSLQEKMKMLTPKIVFGRVFHMYELFTAQGLPENQDIPAFKQSFPQYLAQLDDAQSRERLADIFHFESERYDYALEMKYSKQLCETEDLSVRCIDKIYSLEQPDLLQYELQVNSISKAIMTKWCWVEGPAFKKEHPKEKPVTFVVILEDITGSVLEYDLTSYTEFVYYFFLQKTSYQQGLEAFRDYYADEDQALVPLKFFQCVVHLINLRLLLVY